MTLQEKHYQLVHKGDSTISPDELAQQATFITEEYMKGFAEWLTNKMSNDSWFRYSNKTKTWFIHTQGHFTNDELIELYLKENNL